MKILLIRKGHLMLFAGTLVAFAVFWVVNAPASVAASVATRQLPIYCVDRDDIGLHARLFALFDEPNRHIVQTTANFIGEVCP